MTIYLRICFIISSENDIITKSLIQPRFSKGWDRNIDSFELMKILKNIYSKKYIKQELFDSRNLL